VRRKVAAVCVQCGVDFMTLPQQIRRGGGRYCSKQCFGDHSIATGRFRGENNPRWLGGVSKGPGANMRYKRRADAAHPTHVAARKAVQEAVRRGRLIRLPCEVCGSTKSAGHHDDYSKPLEVRWLCRVHHDELHAAERQAIADATPLPEPPKPVIPRGAFVWRGKIRIPKSTHHAAERQQASEQ
jgi:hypothetical protein